MPKLKYQKIIDEIKDKIDKLATMPVDEAQCKLSNGFTKAEVRLNSIAVHILIATSKKKSNECKQEMLEELSDALNVKDSY